MTRRRRHPKLTTEPFEAEIESLSHDGRGVAHIAGKATFIHGALPGEQVMFRYTRKKRQYDEGITLEVIRASEDRVRAECEHYAICGGCSLQHLHPEKQIQEKQKILLDALEHIGKVEAEMVFQPLVNDSTWGYRRKARLGVKDVPKKGKVLVGFRERGSGFLADLSRCRVLHPKVGNALGDLSKLIESLTIRQRLPQIEMAMDDERCVLILRVLENPTADDRAKLSAFAAEHDFHFYLQPGGPDTVQPLIDQVELHYALPAFNLDLEFLPTDFTQVNTEMNQQMINRALELLNPSADDRVLDLFCGIGNFTLPLATRSAEVVGVEGDAGLVERARQNALHNDLNNVGFYTANLYEELANEPWLKQSYNKVLLDPPRSGALEVLPHLPRLGAERIVYVSCYPGTLARDAGELVHQHGYRLMGAGVMDMFPHTSHVESIALFEKS